jgi:hypothetical protein
LKLLFQRGVYRGSDNQGQEEKDHCMKRGIA